MRNSETAQVNRDRPFLAPRDAAKTTFCTHRFIERDVIAPPTLLPASHPMFHVRPRFLRRLSELSVRRGQCFFHAKIEGQRTFYHG